jgi:hypothetical protein
MEVAGFPHQPTLAAILPVVAQARVEGAGFAPDLHEARHPGLVVARRPVAAVPQVPAAADRRKEAAGKNKLTNLPGPFPAGAEPNGIKRPFLANLCALN